MAGCNTLTPQEKVFWIQKYFFFFFFLRKYNNKNGNNHMKKGEKAD
jgi:hypothetical protein